jgi:cytochrome c oxidase assembly protein subunit 11
MLGLSFAAAPFYRLFCQVTGFGGTTQVAKEAPGSKSERRIDVRFETGHRPAWRANPDGLRRDEHGRAAVLGVATFNVVPEAAGRYFSKIQCFCVTEQVLMPGESKEFPLVFFVDPAITDDRRTAHVSTITLSYTFFNAGPEALRPHLGKNPAVAARGSEDRRVP